jgi:hypothetical protein
MSSDAEDRLRDLARDKREATRAASNRAAEKAREAERGQRATAQEQHSILESRRVEQAAFLNLMRQAGNPGLERFPGRFAFVPTWGWRFGDYLLDRKGRWWRFSTAGSPSGGAGPTYAERLSDPQVVSSDELAAMLARHGVG